MDTVRSGDENNICIYDRKSAKLSGISDVIEFSDESLTASCKFGTVTIEGDMLKIVSFESEKGDLTVSGAVDSFYYDISKQADKKKRKGLFS